MKDSPVFYRRGLATLAVAVAGTLVLAGCGGGSDSDSSYSSNSSDSDSSSSAKTAYGDKYGNPSSNSSAGSSTSGASGGSMAAGAAVVSTAKVGDLGTILVDGEGMTLYYFKKDDSGKSACYGACAQAWPPLTSDGDPMTKDGAMADKLGTTKRTDGSSQVTYAGWPLYLYAGDQKPGQASGNDTHSFGGEWYALNPSGEKPEDS